MRKWQEIQSPSSCFNKAGLDELVFVLLGRDAATPVAIRAWVDERVRSGKNKASDAQILEALETAKVIERASPFWQPDRERQQPKSEHGGRRVTARKEPSDA